MFFEFIIDVTKRTWIKGWGDKHLKWLKTPNDQWLGPFCQKASINLNYQNTNELPMIIWWWKLLITNLNIKLLKHQLPSRGMSGW